MTNTSRITFEVTCPTCEGTGKVYWGVHDAAWDECAECENNRVIYLEAHELSDEQRETVIAECRDEIAALNEQRAELVERLALLGVQDATSETQ